MSSASDHRGGGASAQVRQVQEQLKAQGHDPGPIDGVMGPRTQQALKDYQKDQNITASGRLDDETRQKLGLATGSGAAGQRGTQK